MAHTLVFVGAGGLATVPKDQDQTLCQAGSIGGQSDPEHVTHDVRRVGSGCAFGKVTREVTAAAREATAFPHSRPSTGNEPPFPFLLAWLCTVK